jgi:hypothetical protein
LEGSLPSSWRDPDRVLRRLARRFGASQTALLLLAEDRSTVLGSWGTVGRLRAERVTPVARRSAALARADVADPSALSPGTRSTFGLQEEGTRLLTIPIKSRDLWLVVVLAIRGTPKSADGDARDAEPELRRLTSDPAPSAA